MHFNDEDNHQVVMILGVREEESSSRRRSIEKHQIDDTKFAWHVKFPTALVYHPIKYLTTDDVWAIILHCGELPWLMDPHELFNFYEQVSGECPLTSVDGKQTQSCGGRSGCWTCCYTGEADQMLINMIENGSRDHLPLLKWKKTLYRIRNDVRYREPHRRREYKKIMHRADLDQQSLFGDEYFTHHENEKLELGSFTHEGRKILLEYLLYIQDESGHELIENDEIQAILNVWAEEGFVINEIQPKPFDYDGALVFNEKGEINHKETTVKYPVINIRKQFEWSLDDAISYVDQRKKQLMNSLFYMIKDREFEFIVCDRSIETEKQAHQYVDEWLGMNPKQLELEGLVS